MTSQKNLIAAAVVVVLAGLGAYYYWHNKTTQGAVTGGTTAIATSTYQVPGNGISASGNVTVREVRDVAVPDISKPISFAATVEPAVRTALNGNLAQAQAALRKNNQDFNAWIQLGNLHSMGGDYKEAEKIWLYTAEIAPSSTVSFDDLGQLYLDHLKNLPQAEAMFKKSVAIDSHDLGAYRNLFSLYTVYGYKANTSAAENILKQGIAQNPAAYDLQILLARYYKEKGRTADAKAQYDTAIATASRLGNAQLAADLTAEKNAL